MNIFQDIKLFALEAVARFQQAGSLPAGLSLDAVAVEPPRDPSHGDIALNAAMVLAKPAGMNPRALAELLVPELQKFPGVTEVTIAGPGFINLRLADSVWQEHVLHILAEGYGYGDSEMGGQRKVNVEYVSANPTGPMHVGHARGAVYGDALARLLQKAGFLVTKEYYINDAGAQVDVLARSAYLRYREARGENIGAIPEGLYPGDYLKPIGEALAQEYEGDLANMPEKEWLPIVRDFTVEAMLLLIKEDLYVLGVEHDVFSSERALHEKGKVEEALDDLTAKGLIYVGVLEPPKGKTPEDWEPRPQTLFKATEFGDDVDRALKKSDGSWTYFAADIAYHLDKYRRGHEVMIDVLGADHGGYVKRMKAAVAAFSGGKAEFDVKICQLVHLFENGQPVKMSKRAGTFVTLREVVDEVGRDVARFIMLTRKNDAPLDFDLQKVKEQSKDNPVFYVQYAHARCKSVLRGAVQEAPEAYALAQKPEAALAHLLTDPAEMALLKKMAQWPRVVEAAALAHEPHRIAFYLEEVAGAFHALWNLGKENTSLRFLDAKNSRLTAARLLLVKALTDVIGSGLTVMGVQPVEEMR